MRSRVGLFVLIVPLWLVPSVWATTYTVDKDHTTVEFKIRHLFSYVKGTFNEFEGAFVYVPNTPDQWSAQTTVQANSIDTRVEPRDKHLRSKDFFDVDTYPTLTFKSTEVTDVSANRAKLHGWLSIHGVERPAVFDVTIHGEAKDPWGNVRAGFTATTTINRRDFGLTWNQIVETGQLLVGEEVEITLEVEGIAQKE